MSYGRKKAMGPGYIEPSVVRSQPDFISSALTAPSLRWPGTLHGHRSLSKRHPPISAGVQGPSRRLTCKCWRKKAKNPEQLPASGF